MHIWIMVENLFYLHLYNKRLTFIVTPTTSLKNMFSYCVTYLNCLLFSLYLKLVKNDKQITSTFTVRVHNHSQMKSPIHILVESRLLSQMLLLVIFEFVYYGPHCTSTHCFLRLDPTTCPLSINNGTSFSALIVYLYYIAQTKVNVVKTFVILN